MGCSGYRTKGLLEMIRALVFNGEVVRYVDSDQAPGDITSPHPTKPHVLPVVREDPDFDPIAQTKGEKQVTVGADRVVWSWPVADKDEAEIEEMRADKRLHIDAEFERRWQAPITYSVGGQSYQWHADANAVGNISGVVLMIAAGVPVPNPRPWTPKGSLQPVDITHAELVGLGAAIAVRKDALFAIKKAKQAAVSALTDPQEIDAYDVGAGWE